MNGLITYLKNIKSAAVAFSGGVDSAFLLYAAKAAGIKVRAYYAKTAFQPQFEYEDALRFSSENGIEMTVLELDILQDNIVTDNPSNRCYYCKQRIFKAISEKAVADGFSIILDGTNASDDAADRPGMKALKELSVKSPLRECGYTKDRIRELSRAAELFTWNKPSYACLATRIPTGDIITADKLHCVEMSENELFKLGFSDFRVRIFNNAARLQFTKQQQQMAFDMRESIITALESYFEIILLDLKGR